MWLKKNIEKTLGYQVVPDLCKEFQTPLKTLMLKMLVAVLLCSFSPKAEVTLQIPVMKI
jgi:hypothetical protein